jgi:hypothetical protein
VILPTNTYMAYNFYGGHSQYCGCAYFRGRRRTLSFHRPYPHEITELGGRYDHTLPADLNLLRWMATQRIGYDLYTDEDLDRDPALLDGYRVTVLPTHPEYYSQRQRDGVLAFQRRGGSTLYLGGNGIYERVTFTGDRSALVFRKHNGYRDVWNSLSRPASELVGTNWNSTNYWTFAPYRVVRDHPVLAGTGLSVGATFGAYGDNGPASGGEIDCRLGMAGEPDDSCVIAVGQNPGGGGAEMIFQEGRDGGFLFSASSIAFTGALFAGDATSALLRNVFRHALSRP